MRFLKLLVVFGLICKTIDASESNKNEENVSFSAVKIWQSYHKQSNSSTCPIEATWAAGVEGHYKGCKIAVDKFRGEAKQIGTTSVQSLAKYFTKLIYFTNSNSTIITTGSTAILNSLSKCMYLNQSGLNIIFEFEKVFLAIIEDFINVIETLSLHIGEVACYVTDAVSDLANELSNYMKEFLESCRLFECKKEISYESVLKKLQTILNTVALIDETLLNSCEGKSTQEVYDAVMVLNLLASYLTTAVNGVNSCALDVLYDRDHLVSPNCNSLSLSLEYALIELAQAVWDVTFPLEKSIEKLLSAVVNITLALNQSVKDFFGLFEGVEITVGQIRKNLLKGASRSDTNDPTNILKGVILV